MRKIKQLIIIATSLGSLMLFTADSALAATLSGVKCPASAPGCTNLMVQIPGFLGAQVNNPVDYILGIYKFSLSVGGLLAMAIIVFAGIKRITSAGNPSAVGDANDMMTNAIWGLALLFGAFLILNTINPKLTSLSLPGLPSVNMAPPASAGQSSNTTAQEIAAAQANIAAGNAAQNQSSTLQNLQAAQASGDPAAIAAAKLANAQANVDAQKASIDYLNKQYTLLEQQIQADIANGNSAKQTSDRAEQTKILKSIGDAQRLLTQYQSALQQAQQEAAAF